MRLHAGPQQAAIDAPRRRRLLALRAGALLGLLCGGSARAADVWDDPFPGVRHLHRTGPSNFNVHATVVDLCAPGVSVRTTAFAERAQRTSTFATSVGAQLAINADFSCRPIDVGPNSPFPPCIGHDPYVTYGMAMHAGQTWPGTLGLDALLAFGADRAQLFDNSESQAYQPWMIEGTGGHFSSVINGQPNGYDCPIDPRTAVGLSADQTRLIMVVADGRGIWRGMTCREAADLMVELGADRGTGLDSGGSSTMWFSGQGVLNHPSDGSERVVGNHLAIYATGTGAPSSCVQPAPRLNAAAPLPAVVLSGAPGRFSPVSGVRLFDTRAPQSSANLVGLVRDAAGRVDPSSPFSVAMAGHFAVPLTASGVLLSLAATDAALNGYATVWPGGLARPEASTLNFSTGSAITNTTPVGLGPQGDVLISTFTPAHFVGDLQGYFAPGGAGFVPSAPRRLLDTRTDPAGPLVAHQSRVLLAPASPSPRAVALNLTATGSTAGGFVSVYPCELGSTITSSLNFGAAQTIAAATVAPMGAAGLCAVASADVQLMVDQVGTFEDVGGLDFQAVVPTRLVDTRQPTSSWVGRSARQTPLPLRLDGLQGLPAQTRAIAVNLSVTGAVDDGSATLSPCAAGVPPTSNITFRAGQTLSNAVLVALGDGEVCFQSTGRTHVVIDLTGVFFQAPEAPPDAGAGPAAVLDADAGSPAPGPESASPAPQVDQPVVYGFGCTGAPGAAFGGWLLLVGLRRRRIAEGRGHSAR